MRNAVIRKKRLKAERIVDDYMRMPTRIVTGVVNISTPDDIDYDSFAARSRIVAMYT
ncbi:hypothetical protein [Paenarthrobacter nitroguajacolicus]|uniref:hypothetical protein n=1 Tax=Paenarthrobacter nitroguajacolicus TaxID=211146 RepID=UPI0015B996CD|nr:hypothetical protein [Paenarthrobacter nitroguajacolicus]